MMSGEGEVGAVASGQASTRGSTCSKGKVTAELLDMMGRREDDGGYGYSGEVAAAGSAMVEEGEGEAKGGVQGLGGASWGSSSSSTGEAASRWRRGELAHAGVTSVPALAGASS